MRINFLSDFKVLVELTLGGVAVGVPDHDFALDFSTTGARKYRCERRGDEWTNCKPDGDKVLCLLDNHGLPCGTLCVRYWDYSPDSEMPDGNMLTVTPSSLDVVLVTGAGDGSEVEASVATDVAAAIARCDAAAEDAKTVVGRADELLEQMSDQVDEARGYADDAATAAQQAVNSADAAHSSEVSASNSASAAASSAAQAASVATTVATNVATTIAGGKADKVVRVDKTTDPATAFTIDAGKVYDFGERSSLEVSLAAYSGNDVPIYAFTFVSAATPTSLDIPASLEILNGTLEIESGYTYEFNVSNGLCAYGKFKTT